MLTISNSSKKMGGIWWDWGTPAEKILHWWLLFACNEYNASPPRKKQYRAVTWKKILLRAFASLLSNPLINL